MVSTRDFDSRPSAFPEPVVVASSLISCPFRPPTEEFLAFGPQPCPVRVHRQRPGLTLAHTVFSAAVEPGEPFRWPGPSFAQAGMILRGRIDFHLPHHGRVSVQAGQWFVAALGEEQIGIGCEAAGEVELLWLDCTADVWASFTREPDPAGPPPKPSAVVRPQGDSLLLTAEAPSALQHLARELAANTGQTLGERLRLEARSLELLALLLEERRRHEATATPSCDRSVDAEALDAAARFLEENLSEDHSLRALSRTVHLNEFKLKQGFRQRFNTTVFGYLRQRRMEHARRLLTEHTITVLDAANRVGYTNPSHFARAFREAFGLNPRQIVRHASRPARPLEAH